MKQQINFEISKEKQIRCQLFTGHDEDANFPIKKIKIYIERKKTFQMSTSQCEKKLVS